jgi:hypothetical protein
MTENRKRDDGSSSYDYGYDDGFNHAIDRILYHLSDVANSHARICQELKSEHSEYKQFHYKALALIDFKLLIQQLFKQVIEVTEGER